jgi:hypothetical protein
MAMDVVGPTLHNERGHWESSTVTCCDELLLWSAGGAWWCPPTSPVWLDGLSAPLAVAGATAFGEVHPHQPWVLKDPRLCLTLPFWRQCIDIRAAVVVFRHPLAVARSLYRRGGDLSVNYFAGLWAWYVRRLVDHAAGLPVFVTHYDQLLDRPRDWAREVRDFLAGADLQIHPPDYEALEDFLDRRLRHMVLRETEPSGAHEVLWDVYRMMQGAFADLSGLVLPGEDPGPAEEFERLRSGIVPPEWGPTPGRSFLAFKARLEEHLGMFP